MYEGYHEKQIYDKSYLILDFISQLAQEANYDDFNENYINEAKEALKR